jgi:endoglucanase
MTVASRPLALLTNLTTAVSVAVEVLVDVYLALDAPLAEGQAYVFAGPGMAAPLAWTLTARGVRAAAVKTSAVYARATAVRVLVGAYYADLPPAAVVADTSRAVLLAYCVYRGADGSGPAVGCGTVAPAAATTPAGPHVPLGTGENTTALDLAALALPDGGPYYCVVAGLGSSDAFFVGAAAAEAAAFTTVRALYHQRCGMALAEPWTNFSRCGCHQLVQVTDAEPPGFITNFACPTGCQYKPLRPHAGGYHDAGRY